MRLRIIITLLFFVNTLLAQNFIEKHLTTFEGLSSNIVLDASWDDAGYLWITTSDRINRYDGFNVKKFNDVENRDNLFSYHSPIIKKGNKIIFSNYAGDIYEITSNAGIQKLQQYYKPTFKPLYKLYNFSLLLDEPFQQNKKLDSILLKLKVKIEPIQIDNHRVLINNRETLLQFNINNNSIENICSVLIGDKLFKMDNDIYFFKKETNEIFKLATVNDKTSISSKIKCYKQFNTIYWRNGMKYAVGIDSNYIYKIICKHDTIESKIIAPMLMVDKFVMNIKYNENTGECLVATQGKGLLIYSKSGMSVCTSKNLNAVNDFYSHVEFKKGDVKGTSFANYKIDDSTFEQLDTLYNFMSAAKLNDSISCYHLRSNIIGVFNANNKQFKEVYDFKSTEKISVFFLQNGSTYLCFSSLGVIQFNDQVGKKIIDFKYIENIRFVRYVVKGKDENTYLIGGGDGLYLLDAKKLTLTKLSRNISLDITWLTWYDNKLIICTYGNGVWVWDGKEFRKIPNDKNNNIENTYSVYIDSNKVAWFSTSSALVKTSVNSIFENNEVIKAPFISTVLYDKTNKFDIIELNGTVQGSQILLSNGRLSLAGLMGFMQVDINNSYVRNNQFIVVDDIVDDKKKHYEFSVEKSMEFANSVKTISFEISTPTHAVSHGQLIYYRLHSDDAWDVLDLEKTNLLVFTNLTFGSYELELKKVDIDTGKIVLKKINFLVLKPWYLTWWAIGIWLLFLGLIILIFTKWRTYKLNKANELLQQKVHEQASEIEAKNIDLEHKVNKLESYQEELEKNYAIKNKLIGIITHDLITPLQFINNTGSQLLEKNKNVFTKETHQEIKSIADSTLKMYEMSTDLIDWIKSSTELKFTKEELNIKEIVTEICYQIEPFFRNKPIEIKNDVDNDTILHSRKAIHILLFQLIMNAAKYSEQGVILISSNKSSEQLTIKVADEGKGMVEKYFCKNAPQIKLDISNVNHTNGFGLFIINDMLKILEATITIQANSPKGTVVTISIPL